MFLTQYMDTILQVQLCLGTHCCFQNVPSLWKSWNELHFFSRWAMMVQRKETRWYSSISNVIIYITYSLFFFLFFQCAHGRPTTVPLVNLDLLHNKIVKLGSDEHWHGLRKHRFSLERSSLRLKSASC